MKGRMSGIISDVEAYPAFVDDVSHGNRRTPKTEVMYDEGGLVYIYFIYGIHYQFAVVVNKKDIPEVIFIRAVIPKEGIEIMKENFAGEAKNINNLTKSPGNLCKSFGFDKKLYGADLTGNIIFIEDIGIETSQLGIKSTHRIGINKQKKGRASKFRFLVNFDKYCS